MRRLANLKAQGAIEMIFGIVMIALMAFSILKVASWAGMEMAKVQTDHEKTLTSGGALQQVDPTPWHRPRKIGAVWEGH